MSSFVLLRLLAVLINLCVCYVILVMILNTGMSNCMLALLTCIVEVSSKDSTFLSPCSIAALHFNKVLRAVSIS